MYSRQLLSGGCGQGPASRAVALGLFILLVTLLPAVHARAAQAPTPSAADARCARLEGIDFSTTRDAPFLVTSARVSTEEADGAYCRVTGYVMPEITFELRLPLAGWRNRYLLIGSGGWASHKATARCRIPLGRGYACIAGDAGHQANGGLWMQDDPRTKIDWGYRATHVTALAGKALVRAFYGEPPKLSLMLGCSTGGYQALVEAQRFPYDFAGVVAIAPDIDEGDLSMRTAWAARQLLGADGRPVFSASDLQVLHRAALQACDGLDGLRDGVIGDPLACRFDPRTTLCAVSRTGSCLTERQVLAATRIYAGPTTSRGLRISTAGPFPGSELQWPNILEDVRFADNYFRWALADLPRDGFTAAQFDFDEDYKRLGLGGTLISSNPDLRRFRDAGGKLLIAQGGYDATEQAHAELDYYEMVERVAGGRAATQTFARLFFVPGMAHCSGGDGAFAIDYLAAMERWAAEGQAPDRLLGAHVPEWEDNEVAIEAGLTAPAPGQRVTFTRPVYPYPLYTRYRGHGDANDAGSFEPAENR